MDKNKTMIYDTDPWLLPYKDVIDSRHEMIGQIRDRFAVDGSLYQLLVELVLLVMLYLIL